MSLSDRLSVKRKQFQEKEKVAKTRLRDEEKKKERASRALNVPYVDQIKELAIDHNIKLSMKPIMIDEVNNEFDQQTTVYKFPVTENNVENFKLLCKLTSHSRKYLGSMSYVKQDPDCPIHFFPILECSLLQADPDDPMYPLSAKSLNHPLYVVPKIASEDSSMSQMDKTLSVASANSSTSPPPSGEQCGNSSISSGNPSRSPSGRRIGLSPAKRTPSPLPMGVKTTSDKWLLYVRYVSGSREDFSSWGSLESCLREGRWVSGKLIIKWSLQLVRSLWHLHSHCFTFGSMHSHDITLVSDETAVSLNNALRTYETKTEERGLAMNLYNKDYEGVYIRTSAMLEKLRLKREEIIRRKALLEKQRSGVIEDPGDGVGGLMDSVPVRNIFTPPEGATDRDAMRKLFAATDASERESILESLNETVETLEDIRKKYKVIVPEASTRKDAWLQIPFEEQSKVSYVVSSFKLMNGLDGDDATSVDSGLFSDTTGNNLESHSVADVPQPTRPVKRKGRLVIGENKLLKMEAFQPPECEMKDESPERVNQSKLNYLKKDGMQNIDQKKKNFFFHKGLSKRLASAMKVKFLSKRIVPLKR